jgi:ASCH domain
MKALSVQQPYAWLIVHGVKTIENRSWCPSYRGKFHVHAGLQLYGTREERDRLRALIRQRFGVEVPSDDELERGGIVGAASLIDVVRFAPDHFGWVLDRAYPTRFYPLRGQLGFFELPPR